jgi:hypothetical protein
MEYLTGSALILARGSVLNKSQNDSERFIFNSHLAIRHYKFEIRSI